MRDAEATRARILDAATAEFAEHGIAGARVERIADAAATSKAMLYSYFGNKDALFDAVFDAHVVANITEVPFTGSDLPGYAARTYDAYLDDPALLRLIAWKRLERLPTGYLFTAQAEQDEVKHAALAAAQAAGTVVGDIPPRELFAMLVAMAATWAQTAILEAADRSEDPATHERRRQALALAVGRAFVPATTEDPAGG